MLASVWFAAALCSLPALAQPVLTLEQAMADPDWIGNPPEGAYLAVGGEVALFERKRDGSNLRDLWKLDLADGKAAIVADADRGGIDGPGWKLDRNGRAVFVRDGDLWLRDANGLRQLTRTAAAESNPEWMSDGRVMVRQAADWWIAEPTSGLYYPAYQLKFETDPAALKPEGLAAEELRLIETLRQERDEELARLARQAERARADRSQLAPTIYFDPASEAAMTALSTDGRWLVLVTRGKEVGKKSQGDKMPKYVARSGYVEIEDVRPLVGREDTAPQQLWLIDLADGSQRQLLFDSLPGITQDPLAELRAAAKARAAAAADGKDGKDGKSSNGKDGGPASTDPQLRPLQVERIVFNRAGDRLVVQLHSIDNKDRWTARVDLQAGKLVPVHRLQDPAWINWSFNDLGWLEDDRSLWLLSEESGWSHLYVHAEGAREPKALTEGRWEIISQSVQTSRDGRWIYFAANRESPFRTEVYRLPVGGGAIEQLSALGGVNEYRLSADEQQLLLIHSGSYSPPQLWLQAAAPGAQARLLFDPRTEGYRHYELQAPEYVWYPSTHGDFQIPAKLYRGRGEGAGRGAAVIFVHGAGYTQDVHEGYPYYFREQLFHNLLTERGVTVIVPDYRASEGYGRDWRTAIYRQMGHPELEDLLDAKAYLVAQHGVDGDRIGVYGGSYGGFMTMMALFRAPTEFAAGAALRPVTDWAHYNHPYTANILNTPQIDPEAYRISSPIEHAAGLQRPLLIAHGMLDDNVFFKDSVRLVQRLIELRKGAYFELAAYPLERHGYVYPDSWYDQYGRIWRLFERELGFAADGQAETAAR
jgi:dipeptidyl aminopeptidase/acylaminoacyl peptidase